MNKRRAKTKSRQLKYAPTYFRDLIGVTLANEHVLKSCCIRAGDANYVQKSIGDINLILLMESQLQILIKVQFQNQWSLPTGLCPILSNLRAEQC